jgi:hypothetical protein
LALLVKIGEAAMRQGECASHDEEDKCPSDGKTASHGESPAGDESAMRDKVIKMVIC